MKKAPDRNVTVIVQLFLCSLFWGTSFAAAKIGLRQLEPINMVALRFLIASTAFLLLFRRFEKSKLRIPLKDIPVFLFLGFLGISSYFILQYSALKTTTTINTSIIIATSPIITTLLAAKFAGEPLSARKIGGIALAFAGVYTIITGGTLIPGFNSDTYKGDLMILLNSFMWAAFTLIGKRIMEKYESIVAIGYITIFGTLQLLPFVFFPSFLSEHSLLQVLPHLGIQTLMAASYLALICTLYAYSAWYKAISIIGASRTSVFLYLNPIFAILTGILLLHEPFTLSLFIGASAAFSGVYLAAVQKDRRQKTVSAG
ncbi:MAG: Permease of the drug/metabolite transporter (DMT) superfamily [Firmicutes bacterium]|nr:Permease of the drug/metabolite transporter (DMT) superfamily [Bacillota bacterium]MDI6706360.1 DMT family transporter [Bacillota bacterium]